MFLTSLLNPKIYDKTLIDSANTGLQKARLSNKIYPKHQIIHQLCMTVY
jgi:hypothetical protein